MSVLARNGEPVRFDYSDDAPISVTAHFDEVYEDVELPDIEIDVPVEGGVPLYVAFAQTSFDSMYASVAAVQFEVEEPGEDETGESGSATDETGGTQSGDTTGDVVGGETDDTAPVGDDGDPPAGCACTTQPSDRMWRLLPLALLLVAPRRPASQQRAPVRGCRPRWGRCRSAGLG